MRLSKLFTLLVVGALFTANVAFAQDAAGHSAPSWGVMIGFGIAILGGALGQAKVASSLLDAIARNPGAAGQMTQPFFVGLAFIESLVLFGFLVVFLKLV